MTSAETPSAKCYAEVTELYRFPTLPASEASRHPDAAKQLECGELDGLLLRGLLSSDEVGSLVERLSQWPEALCFAYPFGYALGRPLIGAAPDLQDYHRDVAGFRRELAERGGAMLETKLVAALSAMSGARPVRVPAGGGGQSYLPGGVRAMLPGRGGLSVHAGNELVGRYPEMRELSKLSVLRNQLSYFVMLCPADRGGELILYDCQWDSTPVGYADLQNQNSHERDERFDGFRQAAVRPEPGDMVFFAGGRIWHRVAPVEGRRPRLTWGGFTSFASDDHTLHYWS